VARASLRRAERSVIAARRAVGKKARDNNPAAVRRAQRAVRHRRLAAHDARRRARAVCGGL
jgi:hypothetical protein